MKLWKWLISWYTNAKAKKEEEISRRCDELEKYVRY